jgi:DNA-binding SARP family transcriptional activator
MLTQNAGRDHRDSTGLSGAPCSRAEKGATPRAVNFRLLGPLEVVEDGRTIPLPRRKSRALLALLLLRANEVVSTDRLVDELWGERPPKTAVASLQNAVSRLRKALGRDLIVSRPPGYELRIEPD